MAAGRTRRRVGIGLLAMGVGLGGLVLVFSRWYLDCCVSREPHMISFYSNPGEVAIAWRISPDTQSGRPPHLNFWCSGNRGNSSSWEVSRNEGTGRTYASSDVGYLGFATRLAAIETYYTRYQGGCGTGMNTPEMIEMVRQIEKTRVYRVAVASWLVPIPALLLGGFFFWSGRRVHVRSMSNACTACGYSLRGLPVGAACPECGRTGVTTPSGRSG